MKNAFTLAEVLITLAIIGIVAAMTIPTLINNYQKKQTLTKLKKVYSVLNQIFLRAEYENGNNYRSFTNSEEYVETYWKPYIKIAKICNNGTDCGYTSNAPFSNLSGGSYGTTVCTNNSRMTFLTNDNMVYIILTSAGSVDENGNDILVEDNTVRVDINGSQGPNAYGKDVFVFGRIQGKTIVPGCYDSSDSDIENNCSKTGTGFCCLEKIIRDGWKIADDYPW